MNTAHTLTVGDYAGELAVLGLMLQRGSSCQLEALQVIIHLGDRVVEEAEIVAAMCLALEDGVYASLDYWCVCLAFYQFIHFLLKRIDENIALAIPCKHPSVSWAVIASLQNCQTGQSDERKHTYRL